MSPLISVILPAYNAARYIRSSIESVQAQTYGDFELLAINDGSSDETLSILQEYATHDRRIAVINNGGNRGLVASLNAGLTQAKGEYIARQDADDLSRPQRFQHQIDLLTGHPEIGLVGTAMEIINDDGAGLSTYCQPSGDSLIRFRLLLNNAFVHTSVMFRRRLLVDHALRYDARYEHAEDYDLWTRMLRLTTSFNIAEPLVQYRVTRGGVSSRNREAQIARANEISDREIASLTQRLRIPLDLKPLLLHVFMKHVWHPDEEFSLTEASVLPALRALVSCALIAFPSSDADLRHFATRIGIDGLPRPTFTSKLAARLLQRILR